MLRKAVKSNWRLSLNDNGRYCTVQDFRRRYVVTHLAGSAGLGSWVFARRVKFDFLLF